jgi:ISXO2-like transposase domain
MALGAVVTSALRAQVKPVAYSVDQAFGDVDLTGISEYMRDHPQGIASTRLAKDLKITQKSAWHLLHRIRHAAPTKSFNAPLKSTIESDTTFIGGKEKNKQANKKTPGSQGGANKDVVLGFVERDGELRTFHIPNVKAVTIQGALVQNVAEGSTVMTDKDGAFVGIAPAYAHHTVNTARKHPPPKEIRKK